MKKKCMGTENIHETERYMQTQQEFGNEKDIQKQKKYKLKRYMETKEDYEKQQIFGEKLYGDQKH